MSSTPRPIALAKRDNDRLQITWNDGRIGSIPWSRLRENCPCALCNDDRHKITRPVAQPTHTGLSLTVLQEKEIPTVKSVIPRAITPVGNYAYTVSWGDGHDTGIYPFELLLTLSDWA